MPTGAGLSRSPPSVKQKLLSAVAVMINTSGSPPLPVTPKEYYRDYPDTVSIIDLTNISQITIYSAPQLFSSNFRQILSPSWSILIFGSSLIQISSDGMKFLFLYIMIQFEMISSPQTACYISLIGERKWNCCDLLVFLIRSAVWREKRGHVSCLAESCFVIYHKPELRCHGVMLSPL